ncbi:hypothetical protein OE88DRAFT_1644928 [Heliocybe sulcata]|uniref:Uncharacterized protein n=1 Tax=Heliocybe sulcata TaxID=5364 RepID=A0A5C3N399_9AGAM|nr:hypothetical protein OE88DRAFT_1644928 [Heliocybe sulcata]
MADSSGNAGGDACACLRPWAFLYEAARDLARFAFALYKSRSKIKLSMSLVLGDEEKDNAESVELWAALAAPTNKNTLADGMTGWNCDHFSFKQILSRGREEDPHGHPTSQMPASCCSLFHQQYLRYQSIKKSLKLQKKDYHGHLAHPDLDRQDPVHSIAPPRAGWDYLADDESDHDQLAPSSDAVDQGYTGDDDSMQLQAAEEGLISAPSMPYFPAQHPASSGLSAVSDNITDHIALPPGSDSMQAQARMGDLYHPTAGSHLRLGLQSCSTSHQPSEDYASSQSGASSLTQHPLDLEHVTEQPMNSVTAILTRTSPPATAEVPPSLTTASGTAPDPGTVTPPASATAPTPTISTTVAAPGLGIGEQAPSLDQNVPAAHPCVFGDADVEGDDGLDGDDYIDNVSDDGSDVTSGGSKHKGRGRLSNAAKDIIHTGLAEIEGMYAELAKKANVPPDHVLNIHRSMRSSILGEVSLWHIYQKYFSMHTEQECRRLLPSDAEAGTKCLKAFKRDHLDYEERLWTWYEWANLKHPGMTIGMQKRVCRNYIQDLKNMAMSYERTHGFQTAFMVCSINVNQDEGVGGVFETNYTEGTFFEHCCASHDHILGYMKANVYKKHALEDTAIMWDDETAGDNLNTVRKDQKVLPRAVLGN